MTNTPRRPFIDYFKFAGMTIIVYGHVAAWAPLATFPPIYLKQIGVALFLFSVGYSLAGETRSAREVLFNRLFAVYFFGLALAVILSLAGLATGGRWARSNYLPFVGGANVVLDYFPANPTTWYVGTYLHFLLLWILVRRVRINLPLLAAALVVEVFARALLLHDAGRFVAYMALPNWLTVFALGCYFGQRRIVCVAGSPWYWMAALAASVWAWLWVAARMGLRPTFPIMQSAEPGWIAVLLLSAAISAIYLASTCFAFAILTNLRASRAVGFVARNTLIIFLAHMPVYYAVLHSLPSGMLGRSAQSVVMMVICLPGLALLSDVIRRAPFVGAVRRWLYVRVVPGGAGPTTRSITAMTT